MIIPFEDGDYNNYRKTRQSRVYLCSEEEVDLIDGDILSTEIVLEEDHCRGITPTTNPTEYSMKKSRLTSVKQKIDNNSNSSIIRPNVRINRSSSTKDG